MGVILIQGFYLLVTQTSLDSYLISSSLKASRGNIVALSKVSCELLSDKG